MASTMIFWNIIRVLIAAATIVAVAELSKHFPCYGALLLSLPVVSILAFLFSWFHFHDLPVISKLTRETIVLVVLGLPFLLPFGFAERPPTTEQVGWRKLDENTCDFQSGPIF
jgi:hypothetical protein